MGIACAGCDVWDGAFSPLRMYSATKSCMVRPCWAARIVTARTRLSGRSIVVFIDLAYQRAGSIVNDASDLIGRCFVVRLSGVSIVDENEQRSIFFSKKGVYLQGSHTQERKVPDARVDDMDSYVQAHVSHPREL
jgi:hypothetical protein